MTLARRYSSVARLRHRATARSTRRAAFTLLELLVVISIITLLISLLLPSLSRLRQGAKAIKCMANLRVVAFDFQLFANESFDEDRGDSDRLAPGIFRFEDFVERQYRVDEFWETAPASRRTMDPSTDHMLCPSVPYPLDRVPDTPCSQGALLPRENVSYSFNARLFQQTKLVRGRAIPDTSTLVRSSILGRPNVPIAFDVDGQRAVDARTDPYFTAPPVDRHDDIYSTGALWFPTYRHTSKMNVIFVGGYVRSTRRARHEPGWDWKYQPNPLD